MPETKLVVLYPQPKDAAQFDKDYFEDHLPLAGSKADRWIKRAAVTKINGSAQGQAPFYLMFEGYFASDGALQEFVQSPEAEEIVQHATAISTGGPPLMLFSNESHL
jgi:uncharacterized protein (TIGR02118 family)